VWLESSLESSIPLDRNVLDGSPGGGRPVDQARPKRPEWLTGLQETAQSPNLIENKKIESQTPEGKCSDSFAAVGRSPQSSTARRRSSFAMPVTPRGAPPPLRAAEEADAALDHPQRTLRVSTCSILDHDTLNTISSMGGMSVKHREREGNHLVATQTKSPTTVVAFTSRLNAHSAL